MGTDRLASNENLSLFAEMRGGFQKEFPGIPPEEILQIVTVNPARALRQENRAGKIAPPSACRFRGVPFTGGNAFEQLSRLRASRG